MSPDDIAKVMAENIRLRSKLLEWANECAGCDGAGVVTVTDDGVNCRAVPCEECRDIRDLLA
jgi:hypothetical protein